MDYLLYCIVFTSSERFPHIVSKKLKEDNEKLAFFEEMSLIGFMSMPCSRTIYHTRSDWVLYHVNLVP